MGEKRTENCSNPTNLGFHLACGEDCVSHQSILENVADDQYWTVLCNYANSQSDEFQIGGNHTIVEDDAIKKARKFWDVVQDQSQSNASFQAPFRNCEPGDNPRTGCYISEVDKLWHEVQNKLTGRPLDALTEHETWVNATEYTDRDTHVEMDVAHDESKTGSSGQGSGKNSGNEGGPGGKMSFDLFDEADSPVLVKGVANNKFMEPTDPDARASDYQATPPTTTVPLSPPPEGLVHRKVTPYKVKYPPPNANVNNLYPAPNPLVNDIKSGNSISGDAPVPLAATATVLVPHGQTVEAMQVGEGLVSNNDDDFDAFFDQ